MQHIVIYIVAMFFFIFSFSFFVMSACYILYEILQLQSTTTISRFKSRICLMLVWGGVVSMIPSRSHTTGLGAILRSSE